MFKKLFNYLTEVRVELSKVTWPARAEAMESARIVLVMSLLIAAAVFLVDRVLSLGLEFIL
jgi:preprotein translocase subunit SecE